MCLKRRNELVHGLLDDVELIAAIETNDGIEAVISRIDRIALDCAEAGGEVLVQTITGGAVKPSPS